MARQFKIPGKPEKTNPNYAEAIAKFWMSIAAILVALNLFFVLTLMQMAPRLTIIAQVLTSPMNSNQFIQAEPFNADISDKNLIEEMMIRYYLTNRYFMVPDEEEMRNRWSGFGVVGQLSTPQVYEAFYSGLGELPEKIRTLELTQNIDIRRVERHNDTWTVEFDIYRLMGGVASKQTRVAVLESANAPHLGWYRTDFSNPYGFFIYSYTDAEKKQGAL